MTIEEFEGLAAKALKRLPLQFRARLDNVILTVQAAPTRAQTRRFGAGLLGLYEGVPNTERGTWYSGAMPDKITLFMKNIEKAAGGDGRLEAKIRHVVMHEVAHYFGMDDDELIEKGLY